MINILELKINDVATSIEVSIETTPGETFTEVLIYGYNSEESEAIDVTDLLAQTSEAEIFSIPNTVLDVEKISGLYFIKFTTSETIVPSLDPANTNTKTAFVANLVLYHECLLNDVLSMEINGCDTLESTSECTDCKSNTVDKHMLLTTLDYALRYGFRDETIRILQTLDELCEVCNTCPDYPEVYVVSGTGYGIIDNVISLV